MPHAAAPHAPQRHQPPVPSASLIVQPVGAPAAGALAVYLYYDVLDELFYHARFRQEPAATLLLGACGQDDDGVAFIEIRGFMEAMYLGGPRDWFVTLQHRYAVLGDHLQATRPATSILGGSYAQPEQGAQLSAELAQLQLTFFTLPHQVLLTLDATSGELALYRRSPAGPLERLGFYIVARPEELATLRAAPPRPAGAQAAEPARATAPRSPERPARAPDPLPPAASPQPSAPALQATAPEPPEEKAPATPATPAPAAVPAPEPTPAAPAPASEPDPWLSTLGLNVQAEVDAAVAAARQRQEAQAAPAKAAPAKAAPAKAAPAKAAPAQAAPAQAAEGESFVSTLQELMDSTSRRAARQSSPRLTAAAQLASLLPPAPVPRQEAPGQLFAWPGEEIAETPPGELLTELFPRPVPAPAQAPAPAPEPELEPEPLVATAPEEPIWEYATSFGSGRHRAVDRAPSEEAATVVRPAPQPPPRPASRPAPPSNPRPLILDDARREAAEDIGLHRVTAPQRSGETGDLQRLRQLLDVVRDALTEKHAEQSSGTRWPAVSPQAEEALHESLDESAGWEEVDLNRLPTGPPPSGAELRQRLQKIRESGRHYALSRSGTIQKIEKPDPD